MKNPWLNIPLSDYEAHMALPGVVQAQLLAKILADQLQSLRPSSLAVIGCAGGNGFERIDSDVTLRVVGVDLNGLYLMEARNRFQNAFRALELVEGDIQTGAVSFDPVEMIYAAMILEYVNVDATFLQMRRLLIPAGTLVTVIQLSNADIPAVTPSPYSSLQSLAPIMRFIAPEFLPEVASRNGLTQTSSSTRKVPGGKVFQVQTFRVH
jgi:ubiquinone/menaquinone biosynthesis C-methylase UbiE